MDKGKEDLDVESELSSMNNLKIATEPDKSGIDETLHAAQPDHDVLEQKEVEVNKVQANQDVIKIEEKTRPSDEEGEKRLTDQHLLTKISKDIDQIHSQIQSLLPVLTAHKVLEEKLQSFEMILSEIVQNQKILSSKQLPSLSLIALQKQQLFDQFNQATPTIINDLKELIHQPLCDTQIKTLIIVAL